MNNTLKEFAFKIAKHFYVNAYAIGYRTSDIFDSSSFSLGKEYTLIMPNKHEWYADPFPFIYNDRKYIFAEIMNDKNRGVGKIGVCCVDDINPRFEHFEVVDLQYKQLNIFNRAKDCD